MCSTVSSSSQQYRQIAKVCFPILWLLYWNHSYSDRICVRRKSTSPCFLLIHNLIFDISLHVYWLFCILFYAFCHFANISVLNNRLAAKPSAWCWLVRLPVVPVAVYWREPAPSVIIHIHTPTYLYVFHEIGITKYCIKLFSLTLI